MGASLPRTNGSNVSNVTAANTHTPSPIRLITTPPHQEYLRRLLEAALTSAPMRTNS
jgi:hypothetical protein